MSRKSVAGSKKSRGRSRPARGEGSRPVSVDAAPLLEAAGLRAGDRVLDLGWQENACAVDSGAEVWFMSPDLRRVRRCEAEIREKGIEGARAALAVSPRELGEVLFDAALYRPPRWAAKERVFRLFDEAFAVLLQGGRLCLAGRRDGGVESYRKRLEAVFGGVEMVRSGGGLRVYRAVKRSDTPGSAPVDTVYRFEVEDLPGGPYVFEAEAGVFSRDGLDRGTRLLLETLDVRQRDRVLDLGCGYGALGIVAGRLAAGAVMLDVNLQAVRCAQRNVEANGVSNARVMLSDGCAAVEAEKFDLVVSNPPTHEGVETARLFAAGAARQMNPEGRFLVVVRRPQLYAKAMRRAFEKVEEMGRREGFTILEARFPGRAEPQVADCKRRSGPRLRQP